MASDAEAPESKDPPGSEATQDAPASEGLADSPALVASPATQAETSEPVPEHDPFEAPSPDPFAASPVSEKAVVPEEETKIAPPEPEGPKPKRHEVLFQWIRDYFLGEDPQFLAGLVPFCFLSMLLFTRHPFKTNFIFDEQEALLANPYVRSVTEAHPKFHWLDAFKRDFWGLGPERSIGSYRPIPNLVWRFLWWCGAREHNPFLHHWVNVLFHGANGALLTLIVWRVTKRKGLAWLAGMFLVASAVLTEAVSGVVGISDVFGTFGCLLALYALTLRMPFMGLFVFLGTAFGLYSKESAMICVPMVPLFALASASSLFPKTPRRFPRMLVAFVAAAAAFVLYVESRRRLFPAPIPPDFAKDLHKPAAERVFAAIMRWYAQPVLPKDPLNNPLAMTDTPHRIAGALRVYFRGLLQVIFPKTLSGDYSSPQEPIPATLVFPESVLGALCLVLPVPIAGYLGLKAFLDGRRSKPAKAAALPAAEAFAITEPTKAETDAEGVAESSPAAVSEGPSEEPNLGADPLPDAPEASLPHAPAPLAPIENTDLRPLVAVSLLWVIASYFPVSNIPILLPTVRAERFWYFPVVGTSILLAVFFIWLVERAEGRAAASAERAGVSRVAAGVVAIAIGTALTLVTYFADAESRVGNYAVTTGLVVYGVVTIVRGLRSSGTNGKVEWRDLAIATCVFFTLYQCMAARLHANDYTTDLTFWDATRKAVPNSSKAHLNYSVMKGARGDLESRRLANLRALELAPEWPMASIYLGDTLCRMHRAEEAWPYYKKGFGLASNDVNLLSLGIQCMWDEKFIGPLPKAENGEPPAPEPVRRAELRALAAQHPGSWLEWLTNDIVANGETHNGVDPKYRPRGYNEGPKE